MSQEAKTKEEKLLIAIYDTASATGSPYNMIDRYAVGQKIGLHPRGIDTICNGLAQANFIKKQGPRSVSLTKHGETLVLELMRS